MGTGNEKIGSKLKRLEAILKKMDSVLIAFSGGTDSTFLLWAAQRVLGQAVLAVTAVSETYPAEELKEARALTRRMRVRHRIIRTRELSDRRFLQNPPNRCYYCKKELFRGLGKIAQKEGIRFVADGSNRDDSRDFRPGERAAKEFKVRCPLRESGWSKEEIRRASRIFGIPTSDKPALACLASRIPYGETITPRVLKSIAGAERAVRKEGFRQVRVRHHGDLARIEVGPEEIRRLLTGGSRGKIVENLKKLGYTYVAADLDGYRTGSMNEAVEGLKARKRRGRCSGRTAFKRV